MYLKKCVRFWLILRAFLSESVSHFGLQHVPETCPEICPEWPPARYQSGTRDVLDLSGTALVPLWYPLWARLWYVLEVNSSTLGTAPETNPPAPVTNQRPTSDPTSDPTRDQPVTQQWPNQRPTSDPTRDPISDPTTSASDPARDQRPTSAE
jgi:hypothetical protein